MSTTPDNSTGPGAMRDSDADSDTPSEREVVATPDLLPSASVLAAMQSMKPSDATLAAMQEAMRLPESTLAAMQQAVRLPESTLAAMQQAVRLPESTLAAMQQAVSLPESTVAAMQQAMRLPDSTLAAMQEAMRLPESTVAAMQQAVRLPDSTLAAMQQLTTPGAALIGNTRLTEWEEALDRLLRGSRWPEPRRHRKPQDFFGSFEVEIDSLAKFLRALAVMQRKNSRLGLVWRGHQDANWPVDSSLTRSLRLAKHKLGEDELIAVERFQLAAAERWGIWPTFGEMNFYAQLQHDGVPTRLIDVSLDPEVATWFAVEEDNKHDEVDGRLISWARSAAPRRNQLPAPPQWILPSGGDAFWQRWSDQETRRLNDWGTGRAMPSWQPAALNERMRAQRAAFLFDAEPILDAELLQVFNERLGEEWKVREIAQATRVLGIPSRHDIQAPANDARVVPMFSVRIASSAKAEIRVSTTLEK